MNDVQAIKAKMLFLGMVYFRTYGGFDREEVIKKFEKEFKKLELQPFDKDVLGYAKIDEPTIALFAQPGQELDVFEFDANIKHYRAVSLHELIHKFFMRRDENGQVIGTGLLKLVDRDSAFCQYLRTCKIETAIEHTNEVMMRLFHTGICENEFGRGANEGYTEWFRKNVLKNDENISYEKLTHVFDIIQKKLEMKDGNAIEKMRQFKEGDYDYIFQTLNMSKEVGVLFIRKLDYLYAREYEREMIKKYLEAKKLQQELKKSGKRAELLSRIEEFCADFESKMRQLKRFQECKSKRDFYDELKRYFMDSNKNEEERFETIQMMIQRASSKQNGRLKMKDIKDLQKSIPVSVVPNTIINRAKTLINKKMKGIFQEKADKKGGHLEEKEEQAKGRLRIKRPSLPNSQVKRFKVRKDGKSLTRLINEKIKNMAYNMEFFVQDTLCNIRFMMEDVSFEVGNVIDDIKFEITYHNRELKTLAVVAILSVLGISTGFFIKHCIDTNIRDHSVIEEVMKEDTQEHDEQLEGEKQEETKRDREQQNSLIRNYLKNGIGLRKGDKVYKSSYQTQRDIRQMTYDYDNLYCDSVRVIKDNEILEIGELDDIDKLYKIGIEKDANVMLRLGVLNEDGTITYIAWCNLEQIIERSERMIKTQTNSNEQLLQEGYEEVER